MAKRFDQEAHLLLGKMPWWLFSGLTENWLTAKMTLL